MEIDCSVNKCIKSVILTHSNIVACVVLRTTLTNDNVTSNNLLTAKNLDTKSLSCALAAVLRTTYTFLMCHNVFLLRFKRLLI